jgi:GNAT superfamily N-acetyltransferase
MPSDLRIRRVGFRHGSIEDITAMHQVESEVDTERRPRREPQPLASYISFAHNLPSHFRDHTWLVEDAAGYPVASGACWSNAAGDQRVMECDLYVRAGWRRRGIGSQLMKVICEASETEGQSLLVWRTYDTVTAAEAFSRWIGGSIARDNRNSETRLSDIDWELVDRWVQDGKKLTDDYAIIFVEGVYPTDLVPDAVALHQIMQTQPKDDLDTEDVHLSADDIAEHDRALLVAGRQRWSVFIRDKTGTSVGGTVMTFEPWDPTIALQENTGIDPEHRGRGLAKWVKALMLDKVRTDLPMVERVETGNAFSNAPMLAINDALGFKVTETRTEWLGEVPVVRAHLEAAE